ncbi:uncharacterized protein BO96DRAFT_438639 [Aspergillus niger CBS 101883]|uniref:uncharacterized protein n=1 Tax=Aspergillus lacticoffeatus (strain CBS 101883) TaxID=1450533 RepID=UPI000D7ED7A3|nr:uncharacterized protein BO96DRAFT_438639 [Aspergillus niger CBS 101883]PYH51784.1 hypothetical protein BO96DRAFT_438639 [Aspergillus niger CBS 101883]
MTVSQAADDRRGPMMCRFASLSFSLGPFFEQGWAIRPVDMDGWVGGLGGNRECSKVKKTRCIIPTPVTAMEWYLVRTMIHTRGESLVFPINVLTKVIKVIRSRFGSTDCPIRCVSGTTALLNAMGALHMTAAASSTPLEFFPVLGSRSVAFLLLSESNYRSDCNLYLSRSNQGVPDDGRSRAPRLAAIPGSSPPYVCASQAQGSCTAGRWIDYVSEWPGSTGEVLKNANHCDGVTDTELRRADSKFCDLRHAASGHHRRSENIHGPTLDSDTTEGTVPRWPRSTRLQHVEDYVTRWGLPSFKGFQKLPLPPPLLRTCEVEAEQAGAYLIAADDSSAGLGRAGNGSVQLPPGCKATVPV